MEGIIFISITILVWGISAILDKLALAKGDPFIGVTIRYIALSVIMTFLLIIGGKTRALISLVQTDTRTTVLFIVSGILGGIVGMITYYAALRLAPMSQVVPSTATYPLVAALLGVFILKEHISFERLIGILLIIIGIYMVQR